ncbi:ubiquitin-protein ligase E3B-like [Macrosteles quadrilineatus]|uniref:ubiquitin-protein ligase E3B-like n=1 Tax=Macrosteles quadrilineatus TaxID=74068 RepID=UPI0023E09D8F|nr:ubiquitin-protein ligase E3B-like [Macrosteles quadrilineatus]
MFKPESQKGTFLEQTKAAREERALEKRRENAAVSIQAHIRGWIARRDFTKLILQEYDNEMKIIHEDVKVTDLKSSFYMYRIIQRYLIVWKKERDKERFEKLCKYLVLSLDSESAKISYVGVALSKDHAISWITHIKDILWKCCDYLEDLRPDVASDTRSILLLLHTLVAFTATNTWALLRTSAVAPLRQGMAQLCANIMGHLFMRGFYITLKALLLRGLARSKVSLKHVSLSAILTLASRPLISANLSDKLVSMFLIHILSVPALVQHLNNLAPECLTTLESADFLPRAMELLSGEQDMRIVFNTLEGNYALCLLANLIHLAYLQRDTALHIMHFPTFTMVVTRLLESCQHYVSTKQSNLTHWHPVLGWFAQSLDPGLQDAVPHIKEQLFLLWSQPIVTKLLGSALDEALDQFPETPPPPTPPPSSNLFKRALEARTNRANAAKQLRNKLGSPETTKVALICTLYHTALHTLTQLRLDILTGLCYQDRILYQLWRFLASLGPHCGLKPFLNLLSINTKGSAPEFNVLILFADCMTHYVTILDDIEMYEQQKPFTLNDYISMSSFLNHFLFTGIMNNHFDSKSINSNGLFHSLHTLLMVLYRRDSRRNYAPAGHWLIKDLRTSSFMADLDKGKKPNQLLLQKMPHVIPHEERVQLFRKYVANEKSVLGLTESACVSSQSSTLITVHRSRIVEDGYRQLALLPAQALKGVIRVRFINEQGLDEAGIDQDGVFKEFLEETIKRVFDPSLNLFRVTTEERLYPSPTSHLQDNHLQLFEFIGRMLGKAVYEGIVVDVPFALFFLSQVAGQTQQALYSCMDELPSLDKDLYRSLTYIKHLQDPVSQLDLTFSVDEDVLGKLVTHELIPGGRAVPVTSQNKINYIHLMAHFRMHTQIQKQTAAFIRGFRSIINMEWLSMFSTPELQRLISGDNVPLDLVDLRRHTQYYGGFHDSHRVILWLWDILHRDFNDEERKLFLKFVTSCSKPPLLGFAHLEPPFSIRCVEVGDDEDTGDTIGSVIRGFFTIRKKDPQHRLPTSSTCFNLLKLPNYQRKSTLREKLRYAITSNTGFELS